MDRRRFSYTDHIPERRSLVDRRCGFDRRSGLERRGILALKPETERRRYVERREAFKS